MVMVEEDREKGKDEVKVEGRLGHEHTHRDGTKGKDAYAAKVAYRDGEKVYEKDAGWGHAPYEENEDEEDEDD